MRKLIVIGAAVALMFAGSGSALAKGPPAPKPPKQTTISLSSSTYSGFEGGNATITISRGANTTCTNGANYITTTPGTATAGSDYTTTNGSVTFVPGDTTKTVPVALANDGTGDDGETFTFKITTVSTNCAIAVKLSSPATSLVTIREDSDGDGIANTTDNCPSVANNNQLNTDGDSAGDACDAFPNDPAETLDSDGDTVGDNADNCPNSANTDQADADSDGIGDVCDSDSDGDGVANVSDNCSTVSNAGQEDIDGFGAGDACDNYNEVAGSSTGGESGVDGTFTGTIINSLGYPDGSYAGQFAGGGGAADADCLAPGGFYIGGTVTLTYGGDSADVTLDATKSYFCLNVDGGTPQTSSYSAHWEGTVTSGGGAFATGAGGPVSYDGSTSAWDPNSLRSDSGSWSGAITVS